MKTTNYEKELDKILEEERIQYEMEKFKQKALRIRQEEDLDDHDDDYYR